MPAPHHSVFYRPDALPATQPTASKHWMQREVPLFFEIPDFPYSTAQDRSKEASIPKTTSIRSSVLIELWLVTDRQTDTDTDTGPYHSWYPHQHSIMQVKHLFTHILPLQISQKVHYKPALIIIHCYLAVCGTGVPGHPNCNINQLRPTPNYAMHNKQ